MTETNEFVSIVMTDTRLTLARSTPVGNQTNEDAWTKLRFDPFDPL